MRILAIVTFIGLSIAMACVANADVLWSIGRTDNAYSEFAIAGKYADFLKTFPNDPVYRVGVDSAQRSWPFIQPGPADSWAGGKAHTYEIQFNLAKTPGGACRLLMHLVDVNAGSPPALTFAVNGHECPPVQLPSGAGDASLTNANAGHHSMQSVIFAGDSLHTGKNSLKLTLASGSWLLYDAISLESGLPSAPHVERVSAVSTPMFKNVGGALRQAVRVEIQNTGLDGDGQLRLANVPGTVQTVKLLQGTHTYYLLAPPFTQSEKQRIELTVGKKTETATFEARPEKQYKLFVAASTHTDIGYTDLQEKCMELHVNNAMKALEASKTNPDFKYNLEVFAQADWFKEIRKDSVPALEQAIREHKMGLTGLYLNMLTGLCSGEEMMWLLRPAQEYGQKLGVAVDMASLNDVPSSVGTLPMFLRAAGVRYFAEAVNEDRGPVFKHADPEMIQSPFWWEAPDGSRVLAIFTKAYFQVGQINMQTSVSAMEEALPRFLGTFTRKDYPCDAIYINGAFVDNTVMTPHYADVAAEWNRTWDFPHVVITTTDEYFHYVEQHFGNALPVYRGDMGAFWEDGAASSAEETAMVRWAKMDLSTAEKWQTLAKAKSAQTDVGLDTYAGTWKEVLYYDEHTWGSAVSISDPNNPQTSGQWTRKAAYAERALKQSREWSKRGDQAICDLAHAKISKDGKILLVSNPFSWERDVPVTIPSGIKGNRVRDRATGKLVAAQRSAEGGLFFVATEVPGMGYRTYDLSTTAHRAGSLLQRDGDNYSWKSAKYRIHFDAKTGGLDRVEDIATGKEWVDATCGYALNQFLYVKGGGNDDAMVHPDAKGRIDLQILTHSVATVNLVENGPARAVLHVTRAGERVPAVESDVVFYSDGTIDAMNVIHKSDTLDKEAGYFVFPFAMNTPDCAKAYIELPYGIIEADAEQMPGACREWYCANTFAAVGNDSRSAFVAAPDAPLFCVGDINRGRWPNRLAGNRHILYAYVFNNYWHTNYKATQSGDIRCAYSVRLSDAPFDPLAATQFGWGRALDMTPARTGAVAINGCGRHAMGKFVVLDKGQVVLSELLPVENGVMARLYNPTSASATTTVAIQGVKTRKLMTDLTGRNGKSLDKRGAVRVPARGIATVVLQTR